MDVFYCSIMKRLTPEPQTSRMLVNAVDLDLEAAMEQYIPTPYRQYMRAHSHNASVLKPTSLHLISWEYAATNHRESLNFDGGRGTLFPFAEN